MIVLAIFALVSGLVAARSIVAASDAHRREQPDRWWAPECAVCSDSGLNPTMTACRSAGHRQRLGNVAILVTTPIISVIMVVVVPSLWVWPAYAIFTYAMILLAVTDLDTYLIPNRMLGPAVAVGGLILGGGWLFDTDAGSIVRAVLGSVAFFVVMYLLALVARGGLGFGDVKLAFLIGLFTGFLGWGEVIVAGVGAFLIGGFVSLVLLATRRRTRKDSIPFGPFMIAAALTAVMIGPAIIEWYAG